MVKRPKPAVILFEEEEYILCDCMYEKTSMMIPIESTVEYKNKRYCKDCPYLTMEDPYSDYDDLLDS